ncbi:hypothetical protein IC582_020585 [Cucumis melo]|nr:protein NETWORKED 4A [Cucumis melo]
MESPELKKLKPFWDEAGIQNRSKWLSNSLEDMNRSVEQMLKTIKENSDSFPKSADMDSQVEEFSRLYQSLVENVLSPELQLQVPVYSDCGSPQGTPELSSDQKQGFNLSSNRGLDISFDSGGGSSSLSLKDGTESSSSSSSSDSESESFNSSVDNNYVVSRAERDGQGLKKKLLAIESELPNIKGGFWVGEEVKVNYDELHDKIAKMEEELKVSNAKLQSSENEVTRLKSEVEKNETAILLSEGLQAQLESAEKDKQVMEAELQVKKKQIEQLETRILLSDSKIERLIKELEISKEMLNSSNDKITRLTHELEITKSDHHKQIKELETAFQVSQERFHAEKEQLETDILRQVEAEKAETKALHYSQLSMYQGEISQLKEELSVRSENLADLNRNHDELKLKYDMVMAEKDEASAVVLSLLADKESRESHVHELEGQLKHLQVEKTRLIEGSERQNKEIDDLKLRLAELEEEVKMQKSMIEDGAEGKREAIRQLCFSLEHYRNGYQELREAFIAHKPRPVLST